MKRKTALSRHHTEVGSWTDGLSRCLFQHHEGSVNDHMELRTVTLANGWINSEVQFAYRGFLDLSSTLGLRVQPLHIQINVNHYFY